MWLLATVKNLSYLFGLSLCQFLQSTHTRITADKWWAMSQEVLDKNELQHMKRSSVVTVVGLPAVRVPEFN